MTQFWSGWVAPVDHDLRQWQQLSSQVDRHPHLDKLWIDLGLP